MWFSNFKYGFIVIKHVFFVFLTVRAEQMIQYLTKDGIGKNLTKVD